MRFKRINYVESVQQKVFERMVSERKRIAERSRSGGQGRAAEIRGQKERDMLAAAPSATAARRRRRGPPTRRPPSIYARAYGRDPEFYQFMKSHGDATTRPGRQGAAHPLDRLGAAALPEDERRRDPLSGRRAWALAAAALAAALHLAAAAAGAAGVALAAKPLPALALAVFAWSGRRGPLPALLCAGLLVSAGADLAIERSFVGGVALFLLAHVLYVAAFVADERALRAWRALPFALYAASMYAFLWPRLGGMAAPVGVYVVAIASMMWRAAARVRGEEAAGRWALAGALLFGLSDSLLALHRFHAPLPYASAAIMLTYWAGQLGIAWSAASRG